MTPTPFRPGVDLPREQVEANRRYWESGEPVNGIADQMDLSKGRLYELLLPFDAGRSCPTCGSPLGFAHRTARQRGDVVCARCGFEGSTDALPAPADPSPDADLVDRPTDAEGGQEVRTGGEGTRTGRPEGEGTEDATAADPAPRLWSAGAASHAGGSRSGLLGATLVGVGVGLLLARWLRR